MYMETLCNLLVLQLLDISGLKASFCPSQSLLLGNLTSLSQPLAKVCSKEHLNECFQKAKEARLCNNALSHFKSVKYTLTNIRISSLCKNQHWIVISEKEMWHFCLFSYLALSKFPLGFLKSLHDYLHQQLEHW